LGEDGDESILSARDGDYESGVSVESCKRRKEVVVAWRFYFILSKDERMRELRLCGPKIRGLLRI
jgi:hypothetical protein